MARPIRPDEIDHRFEPLAVSHVTSVELDGEGLLYDDERRELHVLNTAATAVWACCDGTQTVAELADELALLFDAPVDEVRPGVLDAVRSFGARGLLVDVEARAAEEPPPARLHETAPSYLEEPPRGCQEPLSEPVWVGSTHIVLGNRLVGIRTTESEVLDALRAAPGPEVVDGLDGPVAYSIVGPEPSARKGRRALGVAQYGCGEVLHARDPFTLLRVVVQSATALTTNIGPGVLPLRSFGAVGPRGAVLGPILLTEHIDDLRHRMKRAGLRWVPGERVLIDVAAAELIVPDPGFSMDWSRHDNDLDLVDPGRYPLVGWVAYLLDGPEQGLSRAVRALLSRVPDGPWLDGAVVALMADLVRRLPRVEFVGEPASVLDVIVELAGGSAEH